MSVIAPAAGATAALLAIHLAAERGGARTLRAFGKLGASAVFVAAGVAAGTDGRFRAWIMASLVLAAAGDAFLLSSRRAAFLAGLATFLVAHVAYAVAFATVSRPSALPALAVLLAIGAALTWLWPHAGAMRGPVVAYCAAIGVMVWLALGVDLAHVRAGAVLFWLSDLLVARERFVRQGFVNRLVGLPLYYAAQLLIATA